MNPLQLHAIRQSMNSAARSNAPSLSRKSISTAALVALVHASNGPPALSKDGKRISPDTPPSLSELRADVAICVGGGNDPLAEYEAAAAICVAAGKTIANFVCNDALSIFPGPVHHGCTLHPDKWQYWRTIRERSGFPAPLRLWAHRSYPGFTDHTKDWQGSSGLFMVKAARELGYTHIILAGIPMTTEGSHFARQQVWNAAAGFRKGWARVQGSLRPFVRSMSGWTNDHFGMPDEAWLNEDIPDPFPMKVDHSGVTA